MTTAKTFEVSNDEYLEHEEAYDGICLACGEWTCGGCEPDARNYKCEACEQHSVYGASEALIMGRLVIGDES